MGEFSFVGVAVLTAKGRAAIKAAVLESAEDLLGKAQEVTPVDTGTLKASEHVEGTGTGSNASVASYTAKVATGGEANEYALYQHEGTSKIPARKYLEGPLIENGPVYVEAMKRAAAGEF